MAQFNPGDLVKLKSGGPVMTVNGLTVGGIQCQWFVGTTLQSGRFAAEALVAVPSGANT